VRAVRSVEVVWVRAIVVRRRGDDLEKQRSFEPPAMSKRSWMFRGEECDLSQRLWYSCLSVGIIFQICITGVGSFGLECYARPRHILANLC